MKKQLRFLSASFGGSQKYWRSRVPLSLSAVVALSILLSGCTNFGAPQFMILDSYFPMWMLCATLGIIAAIIARIVFIRLGLDAILPLRLLIYVCLALIVACILYLLLSMR